MSAHDRAREALTSGRPLSPAAAEQLLADLRRETGEELADAVERQLDGKYRRTRDDTDAGFRKKRLAYGASMRVVQAVRRLAAAHPFLPHQRDRRSST
ncbi:hypothetical protein ACGGAI_23740 [Streptomyces antibioticus]|uniref:hypothetical protein n=1 Tax=Streptomyces antibioticus TaxID=1890 RepID=UPI003718B66E